MNNEVAIKVDSGDANWLGVNKKHGGFNFAVYAPDAKRLFIHFFLPDTEEFITRVEAENRTGKVFHCHLTGIDETWVYALQVINKDENKALNTSKKLLIDPYAKSFNRHLVWNQDLYQDDSPFFIAKSHLILADFDWQNTTKPNIKNSDTLLYETHVKGFTQQLETIKPELRGTYLGLAEPAVIDYLKQLGITSVQLMPVFHFMSEPRLEELNLTNYWGYNPVNFFAPDPRYAVKNAVTEFKTLVREFHKSGIEVILDVVFNHTAEADENGPLISFKGLANFDFYLNTESDYKKSFANYTGCGNTVNADNDYALKMIMDSLRYWLTDMQVDGFRFDLAATLGRNGERFNQGCALFRAMKQDPIICRAKLIAEPWDIGPEGYQLGNFPSYWLECNDKYRDGLKKFWRGDKGLVAESASRILGSRDIFRKGKRSQITSVNYIAYHDGYTLHDLVSYEQKHNLANLEENRDGHGANYSRNYGTEGTTTEPSIIKLREQQKRNLMATLLFSQGIPHLLAGDERSRTQGGNNNAYCQDNEISWLNWQMSDLQHKFFKFTQYCIQLRSQYPVLTHCLLPDDDYHYSAIHHKVYWIRPDGEIKQVDDWHDQDNQCLALVMADDDKQYKMFLILNASNDLHEYQIPQSSNKTLLLDTSIELLTPIIKAEDSYQQATHSLSLWQLDY